MTPILGRGLILSVLVLTASACSSGNDNGGGNGGTTPTPPPVVVTPPRQEDQFGTVFGTAFRANLFGEPIPVNDGDIVPISLTTEPVAVN